MENLTYEQIFGRLVKSAYEGRFSQEVEKLNPRGDETLERYIKYASGLGERDRVVFKVRDCSKQDQNKCEGGRCEVACLFEAIERDEKGHVVIKTDYCCDCGECVRVCNFDCLVDQKEFIPLVKLLKDRTVPVYAIVAPAFIGQFGSEVTPGKLRSALKKLGFYGMVEVALFADLLSLKEALEFDRLVRGKEDFFLTSCCCPLWVGMIKKVYNSLIPHVSPSVSPMVACGRGVKKLHPEAKVVFIGPCIAKKAEAKEPDIKDAVDAVVTFREIKQVFAAVGIDPAVLEEDSSEHSSTAGRIYARTGGVSQAIGDTLKKIRPERTVQINALQADGVKECRKMLDELLSGRVMANFYEGMGCTGGCVGGPHANIDPQKAAEAVNEYSQKAPSHTPADNRHVLELLRSLGFEEVSALLEGNQANMLKRFFN